MNHELHHRWNAHQDKTRESGRPVEENPAEKHPVSKVLLKQNKPR